MTDPNQPQGQNPQSTEGAPQQPQQPAPPYAAPAPTYPGPPAAASYPGSPPPYAGAPGGTPYPSASGTPYPGPSAPYPGPAATSDRTNPISILAIIAGFIVPIVGVISGIVALTQIKRTGEKGRGLAITGISVGAGLMVLGTLALIAVFAFAAAVEENVSSYDSFSESQPGTEGGTEQDVFDLAVGDCIIEAGSGDVFSVPVVDCAVPHDYEVYAEVTLTDAAEFPGEDAVFTEADQLCLEPYAAYVGAEWEVSELNYSYYSPTPESWSEGDRGVTCLVLDPSGELLTGSVAGSGR